MGLKCCSLLSYQRLFSNSKDTLPREGFPCGSAGKESTCHVGDLGLIPGLGRSPGEGKSCPLQYSGLKDSIDCIVHGVTKSRTWLSAFHFVSRDTPKQKWLSSSSSVVQSCLTLCDSMDCSTPGLPVHDQLLEFTQTHVCWVSDAIQPFSPSVVPFSSCSQCFPASGAF